MEMPEGWKICLDCDTSTDGGRERIDKALNLMKEMAEALELASKHVDIIGSIDNGFAQTISIKDVINKFKEWK